MNVSTGCRHNDSSFSQGRIRTHLECKTAKVKMGTWLRRTAGPEHFRKSRSRPSLDDDIAFSDPNTPLLFLPITSSGSGPSLRAPQSLLIIPDTFLITRFAFARYVSERASYLFPWLASFASRVDKVLIWHRRVEARYMRLVQ